MSRMEPTDFQMGDEPIDVERNPEGASMAVTLHFDPTEAFSVLARADFYKEPVTDYIKKLVMADATSVAVQVSTR